MIQVAILGFGVVGCGTARLLTENAEHIEKQLGLSLSVKYILDIREFPDSPFADRIVHDITPILKDPDVKIVAEVIGGVTHAYDFTKRALKAGKSVVTSNKELVATHGDELIALAKKHGVHYCFEASVGGGIPVLRPILTELRHNRITEISGILNGTTNYILTRMFDDGAAFDDALKEAQAKGYAEADPAADIEGTDACRKTAILAALATGVLIPAERIHTEGITKIRCEDVAAAASVNCSIKLLGRMLCPREGEVYVTVAPFLVPADSPICSINGVYNGVLVRGNFIGDTMFYGRGAGAEATASAVCADITNIAAGLAPLADITPFTPADSRTPVDFGNFACRSYVAVKDAELSAIRVIFGDDTEFLDTVGETAFLTKEMTENEINSKLDRLAACGAVLLSRIRMM